MARISFPDVARYKRDLAKHKYYVTSLSGGIASQAGHSLYTAILSDAIARHRRMTRFDVAHFVAHDLRAAGAGHGGSRRGLGEAARLADIQPTHFEDTSSREHACAVETILLAIMRHSWSAIYKAQYEGRYCVHDQVDISGSPKLADCPVCGRAGQLISEERYLFRLPAFQGKLQASYKYRPQLLQPGTRRQEVEQFITSGMQDIPISRKSAGHGVPWPDDPEQVASSYFSELVTYLSALGFGQEGHAGDDFSRYWPADLHVIERADLLQHAVYWPAFLMAADLGVPRHIFAHSALSFGQQTSEASLLKKFSEAFGTDALRYCLLRDVPYDGEAHLSFEKLAARYDADLVHGYGSLAHRILTSVARYCDGKIPAPAVIGDFDPGIERALAETRRAVGFLFDHYDFSEGLNRIQRLIALIHKTLADEDSPGARNEAGGENRLRPLIHEACQALAIVTLMLHPALPHATDSIWKSLGRTTRLEDQLIDETPWGVLMPGSSIGPVEDVFQPVNKTQKSLA
jgi:methionyl-tRNA synthetase